MRFSYAGTAISGYPDAADGGVWHCQFVRCSTGIYSVNANTDVYNSLFANCSNAVQSANSVKTFSGQHITADAVTTFWGSGIGSLTNSILTGVTNIGGISTFVNCATNSSSTGFYQTVGAA